MLEQKTYTRNELIEIYGTTRLDAIKKKVERQGYQFKNNGRGATYTMTITALPNNDNTFKLYCISELGFKPQTDFEQLKKYFAQLLSDASFVNQPYTEMSVASDILPQTLRAYTEYLLKIDLLSALPSRHYFLYDYISERNIEICSKKCAYILNIFKIDRKQFNTKYFRQPQVVQHKELNGFYLDKINKLKDFCL